MSVDKSIRARCGVTSPMKAIGPQKAVTTAVNIPVINKSVNRIFDISNPKLAAYCSPNNSALRGLLIIMAKKLPTRMTPARSGTFPIVTFPKLPNPQII